MMKMVSPRAAGLARKNDSRRRVQIVPLRRYSSALLGIEAAWLRGSIRDRLQSVPEERAYSTRRNDEVPSAVLGSAEASHGRVCVWARNAIYLGWMLPVWQ